MIKQKRVCFYNIWMQKNLYGYAMNQKLPLVGYKWADVSIFTDDFVKNYDVNGYKEYLLEANV